MPGQRKKMQPVENIAAAYVEDIGLKGTKSTDTVSNQNFQAFHVKVDKKEKSKRKRRCERFADSQEKLTTHNNVKDIFNSELPTIRSSQSTMNVETQALVTSNMLVGTSTALEKSYRRLTTYPRPHDTRPLHILQKSLVHVKSQYVQTEDFEWANEQLKSIRQDITVQHIRCPFVLEVYEIHARILLEHGSLDEFNQCQTIIRSLTSGSPNYCLDHYDNNNILSQKIPANVKVLRQSEEAADEFQAYRLLYDLVQHSWSDLGLALSQFTSVRGFERPHQPESHYPEFSRGSASRHALAVVKAVMHNDYQSFFRLYEPAPHLSAYLMDFLVRRVRNAAYECMIAAYRPSVSVEHFRDALVFQDLEETRRFLRKKGAVFLKEVGGPAFWVDCKASFSGA